MSSLLTPCEHRSCRRRITLERTTVWTAVFSLLALANSPFPSAVALDRSPVALIPAHVAAPRALVFPTVSARQSQQSINPTLVECVMAMNAADADKNFLLNQNEYVSFVNILSEDAFEVQGLGNVPVPIRKNFFQLAGDNGLVDVSGSKPDELQNICTNTTVAINEALSSTEAPPNTAPMSSEGPTLAPAEGSTVTPTATPTAAAFDQPSTAPSVQANVPTLAPVSQPPSMPPSAAPTHDVSLSPTSAVPTSAAPTSAPVSGPTRGVFTGDITILSEFVIYNTVGLDNAGLRASPAFQDLTQAYSDLSQEIVASVADGWRTRVVHKVGGRRNRRLLVDYNDNSTTIEWLLNMPECPPETPPNSFCQKVSASYTVLAVDENETDVT